MSPVLFTPPLMIDAVVVESSAVAKVAYSDGRAILQVEFRDGTIYHYQGVPTQTYLDLLRADSKGTYFNHHIRNLFPHAVLRAAAPVAVGCKKKVISNDRD